ncbi:MAG: tetratricopeptide repeat protein, partial [Candidatus Parabeggiatoa sp.]|nr:tetratricopeptide repeat protein [Candidatus Parabeggiatoa sp.]
MQDDSLKQRAQTIVNDFFNNRLQADTEEYALAVQIAQEIGPSAKNLRLKRWQRHVTNFEQTLQTQLNQAQTAPQRSALRFACLWLQQLAGDVVLHFFKLPTEELAYQERGIEQAKAFLAQGETTTTVREMVLILYVNAGNAYNKLGNLPKAIDTYQQGMSHAQAFLKDGETDRGMREPVLRLYINAGNTYSDQGNLPKAIETYQQGMSHAQAFLKDGETPSGMREPVLKLYVNAGAVYSNQGNWPKAIETYQQALSHAQAFLKDGEMASGVREQLLRLYDTHSSNYAISGQIQSVIPLLPMKGIWSWVALAQLEANRRNTILYNWKNKLNISPNFPAFTTAFQTLLRHLVLDWHNPNRPHRHFRFISTETLLAISESLYALTQVESQRPLYTAYQQLVDFAESDWIQTAQQQYRQQQHYRQQLNVLNPQRWWDRFLRWGLQRKIQHIQKLDKQQETVLTQNEWISAVKQVDQTLVKWLKTAILDLLPFVKGRNGEIEGLMDLPAVALGMLLA